MKKLFNSNYQIKTIFLLFILVALLTSCGFHIGTKTELSPKLNKIYFKADNQYEPLAIKLKNELLSYGIILVKNPADAPYTLHLFQTTFTHTTSTSGPSTQARVYNLTYKASLALLDSKGHTIISPDPVSAVRNLTLVPNEIFEISTQVEVSKESMEQELVIRLLNVLSSKQVTDALNTSI